MRIGELAGVVGITTRAVRHYHRTGLLPEPPRQPNGYREYSLRDAVELARIRRLTELGLSLDEVKDVLADDAGKDLLDILTELDADLARQEEAIRQRRARLARLFEQAERTGRLPDEAPVSPELAALFDDMARTSAQVPGPEPVMAAKERQLLALLETGSPGGDRGWLDALMQSFRADPEAMRRAYAVYAQVDELAEAAEADPRVERTARAIDAAVPDEAVQTMMLLDDTDRDADAVEGGGFAEAFFADFTPAQAAAVRRAIELLRERAG
ncbi:MerR family transcriptional regulator [Streptomyces sp. CB02923]|uniref:MerR family transcriptional regulator n=1 Tax=Streptomyces sp. CB02923 TaxID=1718985 RepID=UPI00093F636F|nr:MerR family transcriptional regulator [Streptomyces sp. CB02923]OKH98977.1 MerR family transcriptional regulator [Streptomyces sp. CB02923]